MTIPIIGLVVPMWAIVILIVLIIVYFFDKEILHLIAIAFVLYLVWWLYNRFF